jgi:FkbM family methyltransferase
MDLELQFLKLVGRCLPPLPHSTGVINRVLRPWYLRKPRGAVDTSAFGLRLRLDPAECVDSRLLFYPQLYDRHEIAFLRQHLQPGGVFLDIGANIGIYALLAGRLVGPGGQVIAVEADPYNYAKLQAHLELNSITNVRALNVGVSDKEESLRLAVNSTGNRGGNSFLHPSEDGPVIPCRPLAAIVRDAGFTRVDGAKFDIEGFEYRVLARFFADVGRELYPRFLVIECNTQWDQLAGGNVIQLLLDHGYAMHWSSDENNILVLK